MLEAQPKVKANSPEFLTDPRKEAFIQFLSKPKPFRGKSQRDFAKSLQVTPQTLSEWKRLEGFTDELIRRVRENTKEDIADVLCGLTERAKRGDPAAVKLWMQYSLGWSEKINHEAKFAQEVVYTIRRAGDTDEINVPETEKRPV